jgi:hypothetical protein
MVGNNRGVNKIEIDMMAIGVTYDEYSSFNKPEESTHVRGSPDYIRAACYN